jgi:Transposase DNA-binding/Transposase Tn5 dimerisation domain
MDKREVVMDVIADPRAWAERQFATAKLGDRRRTNRLVESAAKIAGHPEKPFTQVFDWNELRGFYRLCDQSEATLPAVMQPHWQQTRESMRQHPLVLVLHDTSELDYSSHPHLAGMGQIGNEGGKGFLQHNSLAVVPSSGAVLGLTYQQLKVRVPAPAGESTHQRKKRRRESDLWTDGIRASGRPPDNCCWVDVCDRGADDYEALRAAQEMGHDFLIRAAQNRLVFITAQQDRQEYLLDYARLLPSQGNDTVEIPARGGRLARTATVALAGAAVAVRPSTGTPMRSQQPPIEAWVVRIWEPNPPTGVNEPLEWILLSSVPASTLAELKERRDWYCRRWMIEVFHDIEKNGCSEEERRFETAERLETCLAILSVVAVRVFQLRSALEACPNSPAEQAGNAQEITLIRRFLKHRNKVFTVRQFVHGIARLGGFLGRKSDGDPGVRALWRGYQRLQDMLLGFDLHEEASKK